MTKREKLKALDDSVLDAMIEMVEEGEFDALPSLSVVISYLKANQEVTEKEKRTAGDRHAELVKEAKRKRANGEI